MVNDVKRKIYMQYLPEELKREYNYMVKNNPDIPELEHPLINLSDTFAAYFILIDYFTDASTDEKQEKMMVGIRSVDLLASALGRQNISFGGKQKYTAPLDICATLFYGMVKNHSFNDGNKRTALLILLYQLQLYGYYPTVSKKDFERLVLSVAENSIETQYRNIYKKFKKSNDATVLTIAMLLKQMTAKKDNSYHCNPTMRSFCSALKSCGAQTKQENGKIKITYQVPGKWLVYRPRVKTATLPFHGWTRIVGAGTAREALQSLDLYEQYPTYQSVFDGAESMYQLVDDFKEPLRRLKDK